MLLRASGTVSGRVHDLRAIVDPAAADATGVDHASELLRFVDAAVAVDSEAELVAARDALRGAVGSAGLVDAAAVIGNFERMTRIADATGIPLDAATEMMSTDFRSGLGLERFASAAHTPVPGRIQRLLAILLRPLGSALLHLVGRRRAP